MDITTIILNAAKTVKVSGTLLLAICSHESNNFKINFSPYDNGSPSFGSCQIKKATAEFLGFKGSHADLMNPKVNSYWAAKYLSYQEKIYGGNWVKLVAAYNAGSYNPSNKVPGCPRNLKYIKSVQKKLPDYFKYRLDCGNHRRQN